MTSLQANEFLGTRLSLATPDSRFDYSQLVSFNSDVKSDYRIHQKNTTQRIEVELR